MCSVVIDRGQRVEAVNEVEVDAIGRQPAEAARHGLHDVAPLQACAGLHPSPSESGLSSRSPTRRGCWPWPGPDLLDRPPAVDVRAVEGVDARVVAALEHAADVASCVPAE